MNPKRVNRLFLTIIITNIAVVFFAGFTGAFRDMEIISGLLLSQALILVPTICFLIGTKTNPIKLASIKKPKILYLLAVILIALLCMPLVMSVNAFSMLFVENEVTNLQPLLQGVPKWQLVLMIGIFGPISEEFVFRGVIYHGYKKGGRYVGAMMMSALLFGLIHLNFNQMSYAIVVGIISVLLLEGLGSIFYSMLFHIVINMTNVIQMFLTDPANAAMDAEQTRRMIERTTGMPFKTALAMSIVLYLFISFFTMGIASCLYCAIVRKEKRGKRIAGMFFSVPKKGTRRKRESLWSVSIVVSIVLCVLYMTAEQILK